MQAGRAAFRNNHFRGQRMGQKTPLFPRIHFVLHRIEAILLAFAFPSAYGPSAKYRQEDHYMRGPGPKWRAKHLAQPVSSAQPLTRNARGF